MDHACTLFGLKALNFRTNTYWSTSLWNQHCSFIRAEDPDVSDQHHLYALIFVVFPCDKWPGLNSKSSVHKYWSDDLCLILFCWHCHCSSLCACEPVDCLFALLCSDVAVVCGLATRETWVWQQRLLQFQAKMFTPSSNDPLGFGTKRPFLVFAVVKEVPQFWRFFSFRLFLIFFFVFNLLSFNRIAPFCFFLLYFLLFAIVSEKTQMSEWESNLEQDLEQKSDQMWVESERIGSKSTAILLGPCSLISINNRYAIDKYSTFSVRHSHQ